VPPDCPAKPGFPEEGVCEFIQNPERQTKPFAQANDFVIGSCGVLPQGFQLRVDSSVWGAGEKEKVDFLLTELLKPAGGMDVVEHANNH